MRRARARSRARPWPARRARRASSPSSGGPSPRARTRRGPPRSTPCSRSDLTLHELAEARDGLLDVLLGTAPHLLVHLLDARVLGALGAGVGDLEEPLGDLGGATLQPGREGLPGAVLLPLVVE